jgi:F0F1-type ATP synthase membrane subunit c/vacuolar-type H+-ATPase subunit K
VAYGGKDIGGVLGLGPADVVAPAVLVDAVYFMGVTAGCGDLEFVDVHREDSAWASSGCGGGGWVGWGFDIAFTTVRAGAAEGAVEANILCCQMRDDIAVTEGMGKDIIWAVVVEAVKVFCFVSALELFLVVVVG